MTTGRLGSGALAVDRPALTVVTHGRLRECEVAELPVTLEQLPAAGDGPVWLHAPLSADIVDQLEAALLHELAVKSVRGGPERPRIEEYPDHLYLSLFWAGEGTAGRLDLQDLRLFVGPGWLLSLADLRAEDHEELRGRMERYVFGPGRGTGQMVYVLADWAVGSLTPLLDRIDQRVDDLEDEVVLRPDERVVEGLFEIKKEIAGLRRQVLPLRDVLQRLAGQGLPYIEPEAEVYFRDVHDDVLRAVEDLDSQREILASALDLYQSGIANRLNEVMKRLTLVATVFMPLTFITGFFGMNFSMVPYDSYAWFGGMLLVLAVSGFFMLLFFRRSN